MRSPRGAMAVERRRKNSFGGASSATTSDVGSASISPSSQESGSATIADSASSSGSVAISCASMGSSSGGSTTASWSQSKYVATKRFQTSLDLASCGASVNFVRQAEELFEGGDEALHDVCSNPSFTEALMRQGLELAELLSTSQLSYTRRVGLLAAALQEESEAPQITRCTGAKVLHKQLQHNRGKALNTIKQHGDHRQEIAQRQADLKREQAEFRAELMKEEEQRLRRVAEQEQAALQQFIEHSQQREERVQATLQRAKEIMDEKTVAGETFIAEQNASVERALNRRGEERTARKEVLQRRFERVLDGCQQAHEDAESLAQRRQDELDAKMKRSEEHADMCYANWQQTVQRKHETEDEREHQILRVQRMHEYRRFHKVNELQEDRELFQECDRIMKETQRIVTDAVTGCRFLNLGTISLEDI